MASDPTLALGALTHALALKTFYPIGAASCVDVKLVSSYLGGFAPGIEDTSAARRIAERHETWASRLPRDAADVWAAVSALGAGELLDLPAHCVSLGVNAVRNPLDRRPDAWAHADRLAQAAGLDMTRTWTATTRSYFGRVTKPRILEAVAEARGSEAAERLAGLKQTDMAEAAEHALAGSGWLSVLLRTPQATSEASEVSDGAGEAAASLAAE